MKKDVLVLDGVWEFKEFPETARRMRDLDGGDWHPATVPGSIYTSLAEAGLLDLAHLHADPENFGAISDKSWIFRKQFDVSGSLLENEHLQLTFEGVDTVSQLWLNDKLIGKTENMFIPHAFDITGQLRPSGNVLLVKLRPALSCAEQLMQRYGKLSEHHFGDMRRSYLRKAQYQFGSVMGPALPGCGIFRSVHVEGFSTARMDHLHVRTVECNQHYADIRVAVALKRTAPSRTALHATLHLSGGGLDITQNLSFSRQEDGHATLIRIDRPILWWPRGYGVQHQYHLRADLFDGDRHLDTAETDFGIRTIRLDRSADDHGTTFQFVINEQPIRIKGGNWMPLSMFPGTQTPADYACRLQQAADAHFNMLRVWGGGYYENPEFYRLCDKLGILVWQDFMFASAYYPDRRWFTGLVKHETRTIIERLRNHACLALWCGNSRIDSLHEEGRLGTGRKFYGKAIYHDLIPSLLGELDPDREYIPTTPFSEPGGAGCQDPACGTLHNWKVWNHYADPADYETPPEQTPRFVTEFGLQSLPDRRTLSVFSTRQELAPGSCSLEKHNYQPGGQQRMARYIAEDFICSSKLDELIRQSQVTQARAARLYVEHLRSYGSINSGCLIWTFNDAAPSISFSMVDAMGHPKALYYYAQRFFAPVLVTLTPSRQTATQCMAVINDSPHRITATLECRVLDFTGNVLEQTRIPIALSALSRSNLYPIPKALTRALVPATTLLHLTLSTKDALLAETVYFFSPDKYLQYLHADIELEIIPTTAKTWQVTLSSRTVVRDLQLVPPAACARLSDNFMTLLPDRPKTIEIEFEDLAPAVSTPIQLLSGC
jgi:beta-mannosidase